MHRDRSLGPHVGIGVEQGTGKTTTEEIGLVSGRFLSDLFRSLEQHGVPATQLLGDLLIPLDETGRVTGSVDWVDFVDFMKRLEHHTGGAPGLEACGESICEYRRGSMFRSLVGFSTSPYSLYRAASQWALRRAIPAIETHIEEIETNRIEIRVRLAEGLRPCPQLFHLATGGARALPRVLRLSDAVVTAEVDECEARYQITVPSSRTLWARVSRFVRAILAPGSVLDFLEAQQLELHAKHLELQQAKVALAESERRHRTLTDAAVDVLCELDESGHIVYVSASVKDLIGYSPEQVTGSHFSLWVSSDHRDEARSRFGSFSSQSPREPVKRQRVRLHTESGGFIIAELSLRSYRTPEGELRMVLILRDETDRPFRKRREQRNAETIRQTGSTQTLQTQVEELRASDANHPLERSLALLLSSLDAHVESDDESAVDMIVSATQRMTQVVERAMTNAQESTTHLRWHETVQFCERICAEFDENTAHPRKPINSGNPEPVSRNLQIDTEKAPQVFWAEDRLLALTLRSLFDWVTEQASPNAGILLRVEQSLGARDGQRMVVFSVCESTGDDRLEKPGPTHKDEAAKAARLNLALATAKDAAGAMGGDLHVKRVESGRALVGQLCLDQPGDPES